MEVIEGFRTNSHSFAIRKEETIKIDKDLCYGKYIIEKLKLANTDSELQLIMRSARKTMK